MTLSSTVRVLVIRWRITVPGLLLTLAIAGATFSVIHPQYTSSGIAVLVPPMPSKRPPVGLNSTNPLLNFNASLNMTALVMVQALNAPATEIELGLIPGEDSFVVKNVDDASLDSKTGQPMIYVTAQSSIPEKSAAIVARVMAKARQNLADSQDELRVSSRNNIRLVSVVDATPPELVPGTRLVVSGVALALGLVVTIIAACLFDIYAVARGFWWRDVFAMRAVDGVAQGTVDDAPRIGAITPTHSDLLQISNYSPNNAALARAEGEVNVDGAPARAAGEGVD